MRRHKSDLSPSTRSAKRSKMLRSQETSKQRKMRLAVAKQRQAEMRASETPEQHKERCFKERMRRKKKPRSLEWQVKIETRLKKQDTRKIDRQHPKTKKESKLKQISDRERRFLARAQKSFVNLEPQLKDKTQPTSYDTDTQNQTVIEEQCAIFNGDSHNVNETSKNHSATEIKV